MNVVSIVVTCYNQGNYLNYTLNSVLLQTHKDWECIIVNDGSTDNTENISLNWCQKDNRFNYLKKDNGGLSNARNTGLEIAKGDFILFLDADDALDANKLERSLSSLGKIQSDYKSVIISNFKMFICDIESSTDPYCLLKNEVFTLDNILYNWEKTFTIPIHCGLFDIRLFKNFKFPEELKAKEDWIMWLTIFQENISVNFIDEPLAFYRTHPESMTNNNILMKDSMTSAISLLPKVISKEKCLEFYLFLIKKKQLEVDALHGTIKNYKKSFTFQISRKLSGYYLIRSFFKFLSRYK